MVTCQVSLGGNVENLGRGLGAAPLREYFSNPGVAPATTFLHTKRPHAYDATYVQGWSGGSTSTHMVWSRPSAEHPWTHERPGRYELEKQPAVTNPTGIQRGGVN